MRPSRRTVLALASFVLGTGLSGPVWAQAKLKLAGSQPQGSAR